MNLTTDTETNLGTSIHELTEAELKSLQSRLNDTVYVSVLADRLVAGEAHRQKRMNEFENMSMLKLRRLARQKGQRFATVEDALAWRTSVSVSESYNAKMEFRNQIEAEIKAARGNSKEDLEDLARLSDEKAENARLEAEFAKLED